MTSLCIIPARGGSKRIPKKNIKDFLGKPIIAYSIEAAKQSKLFDEIMVSTEDVEVAEVAKQFGAKVPFLRNKQTADDYAILSEVILEVVKQYKEEENKEFDTICCLLPTAPFVTEEALKNSYLRLINSNFDALFPVVRFSFPIQRAMQFKGDSIRMIHPENMTKRSQDLEPSYHDAGLFYWVNVDTFMKEKSLWAKNVTATIVSEIMAHDIDTLEDWDIAEIKYRMLNNARKQNI